MQRTSTTRRFAALLACCLAAFAPCAMAQSSSSITYQGRLKLAGLPVTGPCDFRVSLWNAVSGGTQLAGPIDILNVSVDKGIFVLHPDFGFDIWDGSERAIQIAVRSPAGSGSYTTLLPRQSVSATPYALTARSGGGWVVENGVSSLLGSSIGVGTTEPSAQFHLVQGQDTANGGLWLTNSTLNRSLELWVDPASRGRIQVGVNSDTSLLLNGDGPGFVGVGTIDPQERLHVNGNIRIEGEAYKPTNPNTWTVTSDERIKDDVQPIAGALELLDAVRPVTFRYSEAWAKEHGVTHRRLEYGVIAQEFAKAFPDYVAEGPFELPDGEGHALMVDSSHLAILTVSAIQQLDAENAELKGTIRQQSERIDRLERDLAAIRRLLEAK